MTTVKEFVRNSEYGPKLVMYGVPLLPKSSNHKTNKVKRVQTLLNGQK